MTLRIRFTRLSPTRHRFEAVRPDGGVEMRELETRSFLSHDLVHYAIEGEAGLTQSFYGQLLRGAGYDALSPPTTGEAMQTEFVVGPLQTASKGKVDAKAFVEQLSEVQRQMGGEAPDWLTPELIESALKRLRALEGRWRATPFGEAMELEFPPPA